MKFLKVQSSYNAGSRTSKSRGERGEGRGETREERGEERGEMNQGCALHIVISQATSHKEVVAAVRLRPLIDSDYIVDPAAAPDGDDRAA